MSKNERILLTATTYPLNTNDTQPTFIHDLAVGLSKNYKVNILVPRGKDSKSEEIVDGVQVNRYPYFFSRYEWLVYGDGILENLKKSLWNYMLIPFFFLSQFIAIFRHVTKYKIQIINAHWIIPQGLIAVVLKKIFKLPAKVIVTSHGSDLFGLKGTILNRLKRWVIENSDATIVVSNAMKRYCHNVLGVSKEKNIYVRSMGVDLKNKFTSQHDFKKRHGLISVGRLTKNKGLDILVDALSILKSKDINVNLTIVGDGIHKNALKKRVDSLGLTNNINFLGTKSNDLLPDILNQHKIFILPSIQEGFGLVTVEAMGCGCAVIASNLEAVKDIIIDKENGMMFDAGDSVMLSNKLENLLSNKKDMIKLAKAGNEFVQEKFDWSVVYRDYKNIIESLNK